MAPTHKINKTFVPLCRIRMIILTHHDRSIQPPLCDQMWTESSGSLRPHATQDKGPFKPQPKPVATGLVRACLWGSVSSQSACWQVVWRHDQYAADRQTNPAGALWDCESGAKPRSSGLVALSSLCHPLFQKHYWTLNYINLQARASSFSPT